MSDSAEREARIESIRHKIQELIDVARAGCIKDHPNIKPNNIRVRWTFHDFPKFPSSQYNDADPLPKDFTTWPDWYLSICHPVFPEEQIVAEAFVVHHVDGQVPDRDDDPPPTKNSLYSYVKQRLQHAIESTIGHQMHQRTAQINYCVSDPKPPNGFEWVFSDEYPEFPSSLSNFDRNGLFNCIEALQQGHLRVIRVASTPLDDEALIDLKIIENIAKKGVKALVSEAQSSMLELIEAATGRRELIDDLPEVIEGTSQILEHWRWSFTNEYVRFHTVARIGKRRRNRLADWPSQPLRDVIHAMHMGHVTLQPRSEEELAEMKEYGKGNFKPRRAERKPTLTIPNFDPDTDASDAEDNRDSTRNCHCIQDTPDEYSDADDGVISSFPHARSPYRHESSPGSEVGDSIYVNSEEPGTSKPVGMINPSQVLAPLQKKATNTPSPSLKLAKLDCLVPQPQGSPQDELPSTEQCLQVVKNLVETLTLAVERNSNETSELQHTINLLREEASRESDEKSRLQTTIDSQEATIKRQDDMMQRLENRIARASRRLDESTGSNQNGAEKGAHDQGEHGNGANLGETRSSSTISHCQKGELTTGLEKNLECLLERLDKEIEEVWLDNTRNATLIEVLIDKTRTLEQQLKQHKAIEVETAEAKARLDLKMPNAEGKKHKQEDAVQIFVTKYPVFNDDRKVRDLRIIYSHWGHLPHNLLPPRILPPGHDLGDQWLSYLARLSGVLEPATVIDALQEEIDCRTKDQQPATRTIILTQDDVFKTLQRYRLVDLGGNITLQKDCDRDVALTAAITRKLRKVDAIPRPSTTSTRHSVDQLSQHPQDKRKENRPGDERRPAIELNGQSFDSRSISGMANSVTPKTSPPVGALHGNLAADNQLLIKRKGMSEFSIVVESNGPKRTKLNPNIYENISNSSKAHLRIVASPKSSPL